MKKKVLLTSILTIALCLSLIAGSTFALFTSESKTNITVTAGNVKLDASIANLQTWSLEDDKTADGRTDGSFTQGGSAVFANATLTLNKIIPGDKVAFDITGANTSDITIKYRVKIACTEGQLLMSGLKVTIGDETVTGLVSYASAWATLSAGVNMTPVKVAIELPEEAGNEFQNQTTKISVLVEAIQGNAETFNDANAGVAVNTEVNAATGKTETKAATSISANGFSADIPAGTALNAGATTATLIVTKDDASTGSFDFAATGAETVGLNISVPEVAADNEAPIKVVLEGVLAADLNGVMLYHKNVPMTLVASASEVDADGEFFYDAATGTVTLATASFSNFTAVVLNNAEVATEADLIKAVDAGKNVVLTSDITLTKTLLVKKNVVIDLNGYTVDAKISSGYLFQSQSNAAPSMIITSTKSGAKINAGDKAVLLGYGSTEIYNVEINVGTTSSAVGNPFNVYGDLTLGEGTVVNVDKLNNALISKNGAGAIVIDGAKINVGTFKVNGGSVITLTKGTTLEIKDTDIKIDVFVLSSFGGDSLVSVADGVTIEGCTFDVTDSNGASCTFVASNGKYRLVQK